MFVIHNVGFIEWFDFLVNWALFDISHISDKTQITIYGRFSWLALFWQGFFLQDGVADPMLNPPPFIWTWNL